MSGGLPMPLLLIEILKLLCYRIGRWVWEEEEEEEVDEEDEEES